MTKGCTLMKTKSRWVSWRMASALLALSLLGMTVPAFAAAPPAVNQMVTTPSSPMDASASVTPTLTTSQTQQAISVANVYVNTAPNGTVNVSATVLAQQGLSVVQIQWVESAMNAFDAQVQTGQITPATSSGALTILPMGTYGMSRSWFIARTPYWFTQYFWWGVSRMANNSATKQFITNLQAIAVGAGIAALFSWEASWVAGLGGVVIGGFATSLPNTNNAGGNYGVNISFPLGQWIPTGWSANQP